MRLLWQLFATLLITAFVMHWLVWILLAAALWFTATTALTGYRREQTRKAELIRRADEQHNWVMQGDERGIYGVRLPDLTVACNHR